MVIRSRRTAQLYLSEYPRLIRQIERLVELVRQKDPNVALLALFGSTARLSPGPTSDADVLTLVHDRQPFSYLITGCKPPLLFRLLDEAEASPDGEECRWSFSGVVSDTQASDLDPEFVANVAEHGVLLYHQAGAPFPPVLASLQPYALWLEQVHALLAACVHARDAQRARLPA
jgi:hypothetical protein